MEENILPPPTSSCPGSSTSDTGDGSNLKRVHTDIKNENCENASDNLYDEYNIKRNKHIKSEPEESHIEYSYICVIKTEIPDVDTTVDTNESSTSNICEEKQMPAVKYEKKFKCADCPKYFPSKVLLVLHLEEHLNHNGNKCIHCEDIITPGIRYKKIGLTCPKCQYTCRICCKTFVNITNLKYHIRVHTGERPHMCMHCGKTFVRGISLRYHILMHTRDRPFKCTYCDKSFITSNNLQGHIRTHTGDRPFKCTHCDKAYFNSCNLKHHVRTHTGDRPFKCTYCDKAFVQAGSLNYHILTHTGERPYKCTHCEKAFITSSNLQMHIRTHTSDRPYKCMFCDKAYVHSSNLKQHVLIHTGERPFKCTHCEKGFTQASALNNHFKKHLL